MRHFDKKKSYLMFKENLFSYQKTTCMSPKQSPVGPGYLALYEDCQGDLVDGSCGGKGDGVRQTRTFKGSYRLVPYLRTE